MNSAEVVTGEVVEEIAELKVSSVLPIIDCNFDVLEKQAQTVADSYKKTAVTAENYKDAKKNSKKLGSYVKDIETRRKAIKKQVEEPVKVFEQKCKDVEAILTDARTVIDQQTEIYDEKVRAGKKKVAEEVIAENAKKFALNEKYSAMIVLKDEYLNLAGTKISVLTDIEQQAILLKATQDREQLFTTEAEVAIKTANSSIEQKLDIADFKALIDRSVAASAAQGTVADVITAKAKTIADSEEAIREKARIEAEKVAQKKLEAEKARIEAEAREKAETEMKAKLEAAKEAEVKAEVEQKHASNDTADEIQKPVVNKPDTSDVVKSVTNEIADESASDLDALDGIAPEEPEYKMTLVLTGNFNDLGFVGKALRDVCALHNVSYKVDKENSGRM